MKDSSNNDRLGHRNRMREKFSRNQFEGFHDYEVLEFLLFYIFKQGDTKDKAKALIKRFGSFSRVLDAAIEEIMEVDGIGKDSAISIKALRNTLSYYYDDHVRVNPEKLDSVEGLVEYIRAMIGGKGNEVLFTVYLNAKNEVLHSGIINEGTITSTSVYTRKIVEEALKYKAVSLIIAHNHPGGEAEPSDDDYALTDDINSSLRLIEVALIEHIILSDDKYFSFSEEGYL